MTVIEPYLEIRKQSADVWRVYRIVNEPEPDGRVLPVPYLSQWGDGADERRGDCGPACVAMLARFLSSYRPPPTVDQAAEACGQPKLPPGSNYTAHAHLRRGAAFYAIRLESRVQNLTVDLLKAQVDAGKPSIMLLKYNEIRGNQDTGNIAHWALFVGYTSAGAVLNDSNFRGVREQDGNQRLVPWGEFSRALGIASPGNRYAHQGLIVI